MRSADGQTDVQTDGQTDGQTPERNILNGRYNIIPRIIKYKD